MNFGQDYKEARDDYVYFYSQDGAGAYQPYDRVVLARLPKGKMRDKTLCEFFVGTGEDQKPKWSADIARRGAVLNYPHHCERLDAVFDKGIGRYLLTVSYGHGQGWGIYDAPEPWGPWTVAYSTSDWGFGETHGYRFCSKWMSADGRELWMVFSGLKPYDAFCVRRVMIDTYPDLQQAER